MFPTNLKLMNILPIPECFHCVIPQGERMSKVKKNLTACRKRTVCRKTKVLRKTDRVDMLYVMGRFSVQTNYHARK